MKKQKRYLCGQTHTHTQISLFLSLSLLDLWNTTLYFCSNILINIPSITSCSSEVWKSLNVPSFFSPFITFSATRWHSVHHSDIFNSTWSKKFVAHSFTDHTGYCPSSVIWREPALSNFASRCVSIFCLYFAKNGERSTLSHWICNGFKCFSEIHIP